VLIDKPAGKKGRWVARTTGQAPEIDSVTMVRGGELHAGMMTTVKVVDSDGYDLVGEVPRPRSLTVVG
jgi:hypothetical protein